MSSALKSGDKRIVLGKYLTATSPLEKRSQEAADLVASVLATASNGAGRLQFELLPREEHRVLLLKARGSPAMIAELAARAGAQGWGQLPISVRHTDQRIKEFNRENAPAAVSEAVEVRGAHPPSVNVPIPASAPEGKVTRVARELGTNIRHVAGVSSESRGRKRGAPFSAAVGAAMSALETAAASGLPPAEQKEMAFEFARERLASIVHPNTPPATLNAYARRAVNRAMEGNTNLRGGSRRRQRSRQNRRTRKQRNH